MKALTTIFFCNECGNETSKWSGKCLSCNAWNTLTQQPKEKKDGAASTGKALSTFQVSLEDAFSKRYITGIEEFDRVTGGGIVEDSFVFLSGDPGIGKSTLALQVALSLSKNFRCLYISGEESISQVSSRVRRIQKEIPETFSLLNCGNLEDLVETIRKNSPSFIVLDSAQTVSSENSSGNAGSVAQLRYLAEALMRICKEEKRALLLIGHVNKEGDLAGPKVLEHLVDTVLYLEGEKYQDIRVLRSMKNRFGSTSESGLFLMTEQGFAELKNPSEYFLKGRKEGAAGSTLTVTIDGARPLIIEVQGLTSRAEYTFPKRTASGIDLNKLQVLVAVMKKHLKLPLDQQDVYINIAGGLRVQDPGIDLSIVSSVTSSLKEIPVPEKTAFLGEIGLSGDIREVSQCDLRLKELSRLGFERVVGNIRKSSSGLQITKISDVRELKQLFS